MKPEDKQLLLIDTCARLPYGVIVRGVFINYNTDKGKILYEECDRRLDYQDMNRYESLKTYLRTMSSMTEEERKNFIECAGYEVEESENGRHYDYYLKDFCGTKDEPYANADAIDWLNAHHFDYRGLIKKGLAIEAPKDMYK